MTLQKNFGYEFQHPGICPGDAVTVMNTSPRILHYMIYVLFFVEFRRVCDVNAINITKWQRRKMQTMYKEQIYYGNHIRQSYHIKCSETKSNKFINFLKNKGCLKNSHSILERTGSWQSPQVFFSRFTMWWEMCLLKHVTKNVPALFWPSKVFSPLPTYMKKFPQRIRIVN